LEMGRLKKMISYDFLNLHDDFYLETSANEKFEVRKIESGYLVRDIIPPVLEMDIKEFKSCKMNKNVEKQLLNNPEYQSMSFNGSNFLFFDGILKGFHFWFKKTDNDNDVIITKGKIERCYVKQTLGNFDFNVHLLESAGRKVNLPYDKNLIISTDSARYELVSLANERYFEGKKVLGVYSLFNTKRLPDMIDLFSLKNEYDVSDTQLYINRPFFIFTIVDDNVNCTISFDNALRVDEI
jgi:hypothetical protein